MGDQGKEVLLGVQGQPGQSKILSQWGGNQLYSLKETQGETQKLEICSQVNINQQIHPLEWEFKFTNQHSDSETFPRS